MEYIYELNLPSVEHVFLETFAGFNDDNQATNYQYRSDLTNIVRPEWLTFKNLPWDFLLYFKKDNVKGRIHTDIRYVDLNNSIGMNSTPWGITWIWGGDGLQEYWNFEDVTGDVITNGSDNNSNKGVVQTYLPNTPPIKSYKLEKNKCFLVCGKIPHKASGLPGRKVISLRCSKITNNVSWNQVVNLFQEHIK